MLSKRITRHAIEWRIRNLSYPVETYNITCTNDKDIVVKTTNKKYYKKINVPEFDRCNYTPVQESLSFKHSNNTLIITVNFININKVNLELF